MNLRQYIRFRNALRYVMPAFALGTIVPGTLAPEPTHPSQYFSTFHRTVDVHQNQNENPVTTWRGFHIRNLSEGTTVEP